MSRHEEYLPVNPVQRYYDWRSEDKSFCFYDATAEQRYSENLPWKFYIIRERICVRGFDKNTQMQVFSNEIRFSSKEELNVRWSDNTTIAKGLWKDIKDEVKANGGHFTKLFYAMSDNLELVCIRIKGNGLLSWGEVVGKSQKKQQSEWISVTGYAEKAFGESINTFPTFNFGGGLTPSEDQVANDLFAELKEYGLIKSSARAESTTATTSSTVSIPESQLQLDPSNDDDDLPF